MIKSIIGVSVATSAMLMIAGCGGASTSAETVGYYLDSAVEGIHYKCGNEEGFTGSSGKFKFEAGQSCEFDIGGVVLKTIATADLVAGKKFVEDNVDVARLLQSIDLDGNSSNGIKLTDDVRKSLKDLFKDKKKEDLLKEDSVKDLVDALKKLPGFKGKLVSLKDAAKHLGETAALVAEGLMKANTNALNLKAVKQMKNDTNATGMAKHENMLGSINDNFKAVAANNKNCESGSIGGLGGGAKAPKGTSGDDILGIESFNANNCKYGNIVLNGKVAMGGSGDANGASDRNLAALGDTTLKSPLGIWKVKAGSHINEHKPHEHEKIITAKGSVSINSVDITVVDFKLEDSHTTVNNVESGTTVLKELNVALGQYTLKLDKTKTSTYTYEDDHNSDETNHGNLYLKDGAGHSIVAKLVDQSNDEDYIELSIDANGDGKFSSDEKVKIDETYLKAI